MKNHHIKKTSKRFFEGWYFKHQTHGQTISFIPGIHIPKEGKPFAFIQIITHNKSYFIQYPYHAFYVNKKDLYIHIGNNEFSGKGITIDINTPELKIKGKVNYGDLTPIKYDIMGPFSLLTNMQCNHGIISLRHFVNGSFKINDSLFNFENGIGYIEKDWGSSFPQDYIWIQCNDFKDQTSIVVSVAHIPFCGLFFRGLIAIVHYKGKEYRFATYNGAKVLYADQRQLLIKKGSYLLKVDINKGKGHPLKAPELGDMSRIIHERSACPAVFKFYDGKDMVFKKHSNNTSFEYVDAR